MAPTQIDQAAAFMAATAFGNMITAAVPTRPVIYARISPKPKENREVAAIERQLYECRQALERLGWPPAVEVFIDQHVSAYSRKIRPEYERMKQWIADGRADAVVTWRPDRLHRRPTELGEFLDFAQRYRLQMASPNGKQDISTPGGRMMLWMQSVMAQNEIEVKRDRALGMYRQKARSGEPWTTRRPFGYVMATAKDGSATYDEHPDEGPMVRELYAMLLAGTSQAALVRHLNDNGFTTTDTNEDGEPAERPWVQASLRNFMLHPRNAGLRTYRSDPDSYKVPLHESPTGPGNWTGLVIEDVWRTAVSLITGGPLNDKRPRGTALLSGIAICGFCKGTVTTKLRRSRCKDCRGKGSCPHAEPVRCYVCTNEGCGRLQREAEYIDDSAVEALMQYLEKVDVRTLLLPEDQRAGQQALYDEAEDLQAKIVSWAKAGAALGPEAVAAATETLQARLAEVQTQLTGVNYDGELVDIAGPDARRVWAGLESQGDGSLPRRQAIARAAKLRVLLVDTSTKGRPPADPLLAAARRASTVDISFGGTR